jgi:hypothetical protein
MAIGLKERLLGEVLGIVVIADAVVAVRIDIAEMRAIQLGESSVEFGLALCRLRHRMGEPTLG